MAKKAPVSPPGTLQREPKRDSQSAFSLPKLGGVEHCKELVSDYGGVHRVADDLKVAPELVTRYITGQIDPPYVFLVALWWQTNHGFRQAFAESHWTHQYNSFRKAEAEEKVRSLERLLAHAVSLLEHRTDAATLLKQAIEVNREALEKNRGPWNGALVA